ncbi:MAG: hypothetical protein ACREOJ_14535 [Gemmatimonadaceae bacterium]
MSARQALRSGEPLNSTHVSPRQLSAAAEGENLFVRLNCAYSHGFTEQQITSREPNKSMNEDVP